MTTRWLCHELYFWHDTATPPASYGRREGRRADLHMREPGDEAPAGTFSRSRASSTGSFT